MTSVAPSLRPKLQIYDTKERRLVAGADALLTPLRWMSRPPSNQPIRRILLLRLERIGDLLMVLDAIGDARRGLRPHLRLLRSVAQRVG